MCSAPARLIILSASSWGIFKSCWLSDWFLWENYDISGNFIWGEMNAWLDAVRVNCRCCSKAPRQIKTCHSSSLPPCPTLFSPAHLACKDLVCHHCRGCVCSGQETFPFLFSGCFSGWVSGLQLLPVLLHQYFASATAFVWNCALLILSSPLFPFLSKWIEAWSDQSGWLIISIFLKFLSLMYLQKENISFVKKLHIYRSIA